MIWNPWHGCRRHSAGCLNCYMFRMDGQFGRNGSQIQKTSFFCLPVHKRRDGSYKLEPGSRIYTCMTSDFFIEEADEWRIEAWQMIKLRSDLHFVIITKRIERFYASLPDNWGDGYDNVTICSTCEDSLSAERRLPILLEIPAKFKDIICEPMLEEIHIEKYLAHGSIGSVTCGGESGDNARLCDYKWILSMRKQCIENNVSFYFKQTGALFGKEGKIYRIPRSRQHEQAAKAGINFERIL